MLIVPTLVLALLLPAGGPPPGKGKDKDKPKDQAAQATVTFGATQRESYQAWARDRWKGSCPPGLAKKNNGCLPPGQAKKRYTVGQPLPSGVVWEEPPHDLVVRIGTAPAGYRWAMVDGDLLQLAVGTSMVVDAISALVH